ncbi:ribokinase-like isoform X1 [Dendronephthya gigantea]|uniref:ribokinase-like isoform X1 n=1 Tax=Dendronephthya gigantea TaxID=151771 RepID=UPI00106989F8|nr:ribokinase-like isoform X1 [Dendronephthya gigantea]
MEIFKVIKDRRFDVVVVGSCFCDLQTYIRNLPKPGETVLSEKFQMDFGGKGANTCVMAAKLGARTAMISSIGDDVFGRETLANFHKFGVHTECVKITSDAATGITNCIVNEDGEPSYISVPGAGKCLSISNINDAKHIIEQGKIVISNNGIPLSTAIEGLKLGKHYGAITMYNPSPNLHEMPDDLCSNMDILLLNTTEATTLTKIKVSGPSDAEDACAWFHDKGIQCVVMTMGKDGVVVSAVCLESADKGSSRMVFHTPARKACVVDTTGAGDALAGSFAFFLSCYPQLSLKEVIRRCVTIATQTVETEGVQKSYPSCKLLPQELFERLKIA